MGTRRRVKPSRLAEKLVEIRHQLDLSQNGMLRHLGFDEEMFQSRISSYEIGTREPPLRVVLEYARAANVYVDVLINDDLDLPAKLPSPRKSVGLKRKTGALPTDPNQRE
jgi:transcriptional regulator with XRE-family HTH domain